MYIYTINLSINNIDIEKAKSILQGICSVDPYPYSMNRRSLLTLRKNKFMNDDVVNSGLELALNRRKDIFLFSTQFYAKLVVENKFIYENVTR